MPGRRGPPSPLHLAQGPTPPRSAPKHTMPSVPRPTFRPPMIVSRRLTVRPRASALQVEVVMEEIKSASLSPLSACISARSSGSISESPTTLRVRGPWDHSASIILPFEEGKILVPLKAAIVV
ncbi:hypothetical protein GGU11DRAFT_790208 [Lentinula aff. detonsa]|uniref:Uncharacterized protein n=1 Tax=Lentinula aff. detonsa TaxID=2804958 RepID=A0AA38L0R1_9AGAR|nr:hypothetical protein GGU10DRAFT_92144 [Lentinula aff. detonsa]KAJ3795946.1 hypothetical protein GGU11DRAFT_790208 [Lentinula aff. detonsa]